MGTFQIVRGRKVGGNVATYFCTADGRVLHAIAGPVDAPVLLREAKWILDIHQKAKRNESDADYAKFVRQAHTERLKGEGAKSAEIRANSPLAVAVHRLLADHALEDIERVYPKVWEGILKEKRSHEPVKFR